MAPADFFNAKFDGFAKLCPHHKYKVTKFIKGGYRRAEKSCKVLMMMKAAKLDLAEPEPGAGRRRVGVGQDQGKSRVEAGAGEE